MGHFPTPYDNIDQLKQKFRDQLDELIAADSVARRVGPAAPSQ